MARRRNSVAHRFARMKGLPPDEKALMQRIGHLIDAVLNNRQASNPFEQSQSRQNRQVYPPTGLLVKTGVSSVKILWDATNSNELLRYEVDFINLTSGVSTTQTSFTSEIIFKGPNGTYIAKIKSVGRDGSSSPIKQVEFSIGDDLMLIEGAKNGPTELGTLVQDNIKLFENYSVYAWGSCVLDKYVLDENDSIVFRLWRAETADAAFGAASLVETITLYPATESGTNLDTTARAGLISRPAGVRAGSFETSQSVMFSPQAVDAADVDKTVTYFLQSINREVEDDEVCLSLVLWAGADGVGSAIPGDIFVPEPPYIFPHFNSFHAQTSPNGIYQGVFPYDTRGWCANLEDGYSIIGNAWTVAMWVRFDDLDAVTMKSGASSSNPDGGSIGLLSRSTIDKTGAQNQIPNQWNITITANQEQDGSHVQAIIVRLSDKRAGAAGGNPQDGQNTRRIDYKATAFGGARKEKSALFPWGDTQTGIGSGKNDAWYFMVFCFEGGDFINTGLPKLRLYMNTEEAPFTGDPIMSLMVPVGVDGSTQGITMDDTGSLTYQNTSPLDALTVGKYFEGIYTGDLNQAGGGVNTRTQYYQLGIWNVALDSDEQGQGWNIGPIQSLYNLGRGWAVDWRRDTDIYDDDSALFAHLDYRASENLVHFCQFGAVEQAFTTKKAGRDTGNPLAGWEGELNWTYNREEQGYEWQQAAAGANYHKRKIEGIWYDNLPQSWDRGTDIYDVLSPGGTNNTIEYGFSYPGQNMSGKGPIGNGHLAADQATDSVPASKVSAPYPPGYHIEDADRPIKGGA